MGTELIVRPAKTAPRLRGLFLVVFTVFFVAIGACSRPGGDGVGGSQGVLTVAGSTSVQPFAERLAEDFVKGRPEISINVQGGGSTAGVRAAQTGAAGIGMSSRNLKESEQALLQYPIAYDGIAIIVHNDNPVHGLTREQIARIFAGEIANWNGVGGRDHPIHYVTREEGSGTRGAFEEMVMGERIVSPRALVQDSNGAVREIVASDRNAMGFISLGLVDERVQALAVDGVAPDLDAIVSKTYAVVRPFLFLSREEPAGTARDFIDFVLGPEGQHLLALEGLVPVAP